MKSDNAWRPQDMCGGNGRRPCVWYEGETNRTTRPLFTPHGHRMDSVSIGQNHRTSEREGNAEYLRMGSAVQGRERAEDVSPSCDWRLPCAGKGPPSNAINIPPNLVLPSHSTTDRLFSSVGRPSNQSHFPHPLPHTKTSQPAWPSIQFRSPVANLPPSVHPQCPVEAPAGSSPGRQRSQRTSPQFIQICL